MRFRNSLPSGQILSCKKPQLQLVISLIGFLIILKSHNTDALREKQSCHEHTNVGGKHNTERLKDIDDKLDSLYDAIRTNATYEEVCNDSVKINETDINLSNLIEKFEIRRSFYDQGLWGYCADEGATKLIHDIDILLNITSDTNSKGTPMTICNRDELLECHPTFKKCQCIVDVRDFRNVVSEYWEDEEETNTRETKGKSLGRDGCVLKAGSNCPVANESPFLCVPGTNCLTMNGHKPCTLKNVVSSVLSLPSRSKRSANRRYSFIKDTYPTIHCQCYGYESPRA